MYTYVCKVVEVQAPAPPVVKVAHTLPALVPLSLQPILVRENDPEPLYYILRTRSLQHCTSASI